MYFSFLPLLLIILNILAYVIGLTLGVLGILALLKYLRQPS